MWTDKENVGREVITLMRAVIHECHRALFSLSDLLVPSGAENSEEQATQIMESCPVEGSHPTIQHEAAAAAAAEKERKYVYNDKPTKLLVDLTCLQIYQNE